MTNLHHKYKLKGSPIQFTQENREKFNIFKTLFITLIVLITVIAGLFFTLPKDASGVYQQFFYFNDIPDQILSSFKILISLAALGITGYLIYHTYMFSQLRKSQLTDVQREKDDIDYKSMIGKAPGFFDNINLNYLANYSPLA